MSLNIKNKKVEMLIDSITALTGETKTEAVHKALEERKQRLAMKNQMLNRQLLLNEFLENEIWSRIPADLIGMDYSQEEQDRVLGFGVDGV